MDRSSLARLVDGFSRQGRGLVRRYVPFAVRSHESPGQSLPALLEGLARDLLSDRGEASGVAIASDLLAAYRRAGSDERLAFLDRLATGFNPDEQRLDAAWDAYRRDGIAALPGLARAVESPRLELFCRLNLAPGGTAALIALRSDILAGWARIAHAELLDADLVHLLQSWFNRGFLTLQQIGWSSPASLLERVIRYEAVHHIRDWSDLRSRIEPSDRRCFGFFHPALPEEPLIFVEVALTRGIPASIQQLLEPDRRPLAAEDSDTAVFYSISNCQPGLRGISFGHFLIKQVATDLKRELPGLKRFVTLSPIPGLMKWLASEQPELAARAAATDLTTADDELRRALLGQAVAYLTAARGADQRPLDPVARFHLGNGARLERLDWLGDVSPNGLRQSAGMMVNYLYDLPRIEEYHEAYANQGRIVVGEPLRRLMRTLAGEADGRRKR